MSQTDWTHIPERGSLLLMRMGLFVVNFLGYPMGKLIALISAGYFTLTGRLSRRASYTYQQQVHQFAPEALGPPSFRQAFRHHLSFAINVLDRAWLWQGKLKQFTFTREGREHIRNRKSGILLMGSHLGSFDAMRAFSLDQQVPLNVVMYRAHAFKFNQFLKLINPEANLQIVDLDEGSVDQVFLLKERLDAGEIVAILADRPAPYGRKRILELDFLGKPAPFPQNPWILASLLECPVFFTVGLRVGPRSYHMRVEPLADRIVLPRKTREAALRGYMELYVRRLEELCVQHPYQWFNFYDFWLHPQPETEDNQTLSARSGGSHEP